MLLRAPRSHKQVATLLPTELLSVTLRTETANLHRETESSMDFPNSISTLSQYKLWLVRFYCLYRPLEKTLGGFDRWLAAGIDLPELLQAGKLAHDLDTLGISPLELQDAPKTSMPSLHEFGSALGALYVLEGSKLGSQIILRHVAAVLGNEIKGADSFFGGDRSRTPESWREFRVLLDGYGASHPQEIPSVIDGAKETFEAIGRWMQP